MGVRHEQQRWQVITLLTALTIAACSDSTGSDDTDSGNAEFVVTISSSSGVTSPAQPVTLTVTAENSTTSRVVWGEGSSTCQLRALVRVDGIDYLASTTRICTADLTELGLDPEETRTESFEWAGHAVRESLELLPAGSYEVRGAAGELAISAPVVITVLDSP